MKRRQRSRSARNAGAPAVAASAPIFSVPSQQPSWSSAEDSRRRTWELAIGSATALIVALLGAWTASKHQGSSTIVANTSSANIFLQVPAAGAISPAPLPDSVPSARPADPAGAGHAGPQGQGGTTYDYNYGATPPKATTPRAQRPVPVPLPEVSWNSGVPTYDTGTTYPPADGPKYNWGTTREATQGLWDTGSAGSGVG